MRERSLFHLLSWKRLFPRFFQSANIFLLIEFFDELNYGAQAAAIPAMRSEFRLDYAQVGLLLGLSGLVGGLVEPIIMLLGDTRWRLPLIVGGGLTVAASLALAAASQTLFPLLLAFTVAYPASGAFVTLAQASLMDQNPDHKSQLMARWTAAGSLGSLIGPAFFSLSLTFGISWRGLFIFLAVLGSGLALSTWKTAGGISQFSRRSLTKSHISELIPSLFRGLKRLSLVRWLVLLQMSDLLLDIYTIYISLYLVDVVGISKAQTGIFLSGLMLVNFLTDLLLIPLLERTSGLLVVRVSALMACLVYPALLITPWEAAKVGLALTVRLTTLGWYPVLKAQAYDSLPDRSGTVLAAESLASNAGKLLLWFVGWLAAQVGLDAAMWLLITGPLSLVLFIHPNARQSNCSKI
jgi:FSR family fosmidomycin resistance protein-like MFS transporter